MKLCRFEFGGTPHFGLLDGESIYNLSSSDLPLKDLHHAYSEASARGQDFHSIVLESKGKAEAFPFREGMLRIPFMPREIWAAGVTYLRSREARESETKTKGLYDYVYSSERPELFVKDTGLRCRGPGDDICIREDSKWNVPEPELSVVLDSDFRIVGYTAGNDVSSRDIEGENPLFLPQAKVYTGSSAIGPVLTTGDEIPDPHSLKISMTIRRGKDVAFSGTVNTSQMKRRVGELVGFLKRSNAIETFTVLMTGTSIVPPDDFTLSEGDVVDIDIEKIGLLRNPVRRLAG